mgnify:FL=1
MASTFKNQGMTLVHTNDANANFYTAPGGTYSVVHALYLSNNSVTNNGEVDVKITTDGGSTFYNIGTKLSIPPKNTLTLDKPINLEPGDIMRLVATPLPDSSSTEITAVASILEVT